MRWLKGPPFFGNLCVDCRSSIARELQEEGEVASEMRPAEAGAPAQVFKCFEILICVVAD